MNVKLFPEQLVDLQGESLRSLTSFSPELAICVTIVALLLFRMLAGQRVAAVAIALVGSAVALGLAIQQCCSAAGREEIFTGMLVYDEFSVFFRIFLLAFSVLFVLFTWRSGIPDREDGYDLYALALGAILGMCLMASANHLLMIFMAVEMASVPSYALSGLLKGRRQSSEAALKFSVYGAATAGVMLYGISLLAGVLGTVHVPTAAARLADLLAGNPSADTVTVLSLAGLMVMVGLAFKLSAVPFHFWAPDVFEGASAEIGGFLSVASKAAALALLARLAIGLGYDSSTQLAAPYAATASVHHVALAAAEAESAAPQASADGHPAATAKSDPHPTPVTRRAALEPARVFMANLVGFLAAITATFGNLAAYGQTNIKRLLAYSTIAHAGIMMMPVAGALLLAGSDTNAAAHALGAVGFYVAIYLFMNLGAFAIVAFLRNELRSEEIQDYAGLIQRAPGVALCFALILMSLLGLPPLAGFVAKLVAFGALADARWLTLLIIGCLNGALSLFYYLRVVKVMCLDAAPAGAVPVRLPLFTSINGWLLIVLTAPLLYLGVLWSGVFEWAVLAARSLLL